VLRLADAAASRPETKKAVLLIVSLCRAMIAASLWAVSSSICGSTSHLHTYTHTFTHACANQRSLTTLPPTTCTNAPDAQALDHMHSSPDGAPPDIGRFLRPVSAHDLKHMRMLASLSGLTYYMGTKVTPRMLLRRHRLELISTSLACERICYEHQASAREVVDEGDGSCLSVPEARVIYWDREGPLPAGPDAAAATATAAAAAAHTEPAATAALANVVPFSRSLVGSTMAADQQRRLLQQQHHEEQQLVAAAMAGSSRTSNSSVALATAAATSNSAVATATASNSSSSNSASATPADSKPAAGSWKPTDLVAAKLGEAAAAASAAALAPLASAASAASAVALGPLASVAGSIYAGGLGLVSSKFFFNGAAAASQPLIAERLAGAAIAGIARAEVATSHPNSSEVKAASTSPAACPSEWFVADDGRTHTRYFVIQGSDSLDHWKTNLMFEPVVFEDPSLGIKVRWFGLG